MKRQPPSKVIDETVSFVLVYERLNDIQVVLEACIMQRSLQLLVDTINISELLRLEKKF